jgi:putative endonuclease
MAEHNDLGKRGEEIAVKYLENQGFTIRHTNWRNRFEEIDIVAEKGDFLIIVEVKTRRSNFFGQPQDSVTLTKQRLLVNAAQAYIETFNIDLETRFDIVSILISADEQVNIEHIPYAFSPFD